jgi:hypothetical protein
MNGISLRSFAAPIARSILLRIVQPVLRTCPRPRERRNILLVAPNSLMLEYLIDLWEVLRSDKRLRFFVLGPFEADYEQKRLIARRIQDIRAYVGRWDLVVAADHPNGPKLNSILDGDRWPTLRIPHGIPGKRVNGEIYAFGRHSYNRKGHIRYTCMFAGSESEHAMALAMNPAFRNVVAVVGSLQDDRLLAMAESREKIRRNVGFKLEEKVVFVLSTWGRHGLFNSMGDAFLKSARKLLGEFRFVLAPHPLDYRPKPNGQRVWGDYLRSQKQYGFLIREPGEDWMPYMAACDAILTDHTALALHGTLIRRPTVTVPIPDEVVEKGSPFWYLRNISPVIRDDASDLRHRLLDALENYPSEMLSLVAERINSCPGRSAVKIRKEVYNLLNLTLLAN